MVHGAGAKPQIGQLGSRNQAVLLLGNGRSRPLHLTRPRFTLYFNVNLSLVAHAAQGPAPRVTCG
jgi:hypothetical protein